MKKIYLLMMFALLGMVANAQTFQKVTDVAQLADGDKVIIVNEEFNTIMGEQSGKYRVKLNVTISGNEIVAPQGAAIFTLGKNSDGTFTFNDGIGYLYCNAKNSLYTGGENNNINWEIAIDADVTTIINSIFVDSDEKKYEIMYNSIKGSERFACYASTQKNITLYKEIKATQVVTPTFSVEAGEIYPDTEIEINCATDGATIKYTLDEDPTVFDYSAPLVFTEIGKTVTITAWAEAEGLDASEQAVVTYTVVEKPEGTDFVKVTDLSQLKDGDKVIIACESKNTILAAPDDDVRGYVEFGLSESFTLPGTSGASILTLGIENGQYTFFDGTYYLALTSDGNKLHSVEMIGENKQEYWTIDINAGETTITSVAYSGRSMKYNASAPRFACYEKGQESVSIYREPNGSSSVNDAVANEFKAVAVVNGIEVNVAEAGLVSVYNAAGQLVANVNVAEGATTINVAGGFYIVKAGNNVAKVLVK